MTDRSSSLSLSPDSMTTILSNPGRIEMLDDPGLGLFPMVSLIIGLTVFSARTCITLLGLWKHSSSHSSSVILSSSKVFLFVGLGEICVSFKLSIGLAFSGPRVLTSSSPLIYGCDSPTFYSSSASAMAARSTTTIRGSFPSLLFAPLSSFPVPSMSISFCALSL
ncbi:hypothetical protein PIB30_025966 [Stylosanthes scabra]|uniref:Uncharacterized protein n=1 Tax=Stylosanthes scabra TaxID=79078 RepID=A0ABU6SA52_9FABA|nr:hypothetical protein [Stylosanthes scabra]